MTYYNLMELGVDCPSLNAVDLVLLCDQLNNEVKHLQKTKFYSRSDAQAMVAEQHDLLSVEVLGETEVFSLPTLQTIMLDADGFIPFDEVSFESLQEWEDGDTYIDPERLAYAWGGWGE